MNWQVLPSCQDASVNHVLAQPDGGHWEARLMQRVEEYFICYLSSHTGCAHSCRFCHLTATGQVMMTPATVEDYLEQADQVLHTYRQRLEQGQTPAQRLHFNFMARGEALSNPHFLAHSNELFEQLGERAENLGAQPKFLVSTIFPRDFKADLSSILADERAVPYYSLYSVNPRFRKRWLPKSHDPRHALAQLAAFQKGTERKVVLHWAFIAGENDSMEDVHATLDAVGEAGLKAKFNLVRYNPHDSRHGVEPDEAHLDAVFAVINERMGLPGSRIVPRVGFDVKASCGMFIGSRPGRTIPAQVVGD